MPSRFLGRPCWVDISTSAFENNFRILESLAPGAELLAIVKADAFDYSRFGSIEGKVARISPESKADVPGQQPFFVAEIELAQGYVGVDKSHVVTPGMTGEASILTGDKTIFQYLLKPIYVTLDSALRER